MAQWYRICLPMQKLQATQVQFLSREEPPRVGNGTQLQYYCLENPMDRGVWRATVHGSAESDTTECTHVRAHTQHTHHMHYKWLNGCACKESTCYAGPRLEYKTTFLNGFWYLLFFFLGIHLTYFERQLQLAAFRTFMKVTHRKMHHWSYLQTSINSLLWCSSVSNCSMALPVIPHIRASFYSLASLPRCSCLTIYIPEHVTFD